MIKLKEINKTSPDYKKIEQLYLSAFPIEERISTSMILSKIAEGKAVLYGIYDNEWIGLAYIIKYHQLSYLFYFAIADEYKNKGYGTQVLEVLQKQNQTLCLSIEEVDKKYDNYKQRLHRKNFYLRNGFKEMNFMIEEEHVRYEMLYSGKAFHSKQYDQLMYHFMGESYSTFRNFNI